MVPRSSPASNAEWPAPRLLPPAALDRLLEAALAAYRVGALDRYCRQRERVARWALKRFVAPLAWFDPAVVGPPAEGPALGWQLECALRWAVLQLRPDGAAAQAPIPPHAWAGATPWRPMLALACHHTLLQVAELPQRYRPRAGEPAFEHLCGLWDIAPSSFYRYIERGRQLLALELTSAMTAPRALSLAAFACEASCQRLGLKEPTDRLVWHRASAMALLRHGGPRATVGALWHTARAGDTVAVLGMLEAHSLDLAASGFTDAVLASLDVGDADSTPRLQLALARANLAQVRGNLADEQSQLALALRHAVTLGEPLWLGTVYAARGRCNEARDVERAMTDYREAVSSFDQAMPSAPDLRVVTALVGALCSLAELYLLRNDPRAVSILARAEQLCAGGGIPVDLQARLQLALGEYWQRQGNLPKAIETTHRALSLSESAGHQRRVVSAWGRLARQYTIAQDIDQALHYARLVTSVGSETLLAPETLAATELNIGAAFFWKDCLKEAIEHYLRAAQIAQAAGLNTILGRAQYNLAEAHFTRFQREGNIEDEMQGDAFARMSQAIWDADNDAAHGEATRNLKRTVLGERQHLVYDQLLPAELAKHFDAMKLIEQQRQRFETSSAPGERVDARLRIAQAYLHIAVAEREAALSLAREHGLQAELSPQLQALRQTFDSALSEQEQWVARWTDAHAIPREHVAALVQRLASDGELTKSGCAETCAVSPATASKYLADLAGAGLLTRVGKGPATRYLPP
jgi:tetratricopeptide (TPR) repeat protein